MTAPVDHDDYIASAPEPFRPLLTDLRQELARALPDAKEIVAYNMPGFGYDGTIVAGYAAFTKQCGLYVANDAISENAKAIAEAGLKATKTGVTFSPKKPIPMDLVARLARASWKHATS